MTRHEITFVVAIPSLDEVLAMPANGLAALGHTVYLWQTRAAMRRHLAEMDDRMRRDAGLSLDDIAGEIRKPFWRA